MAIMIKIKTEIKNNFKEKVNNFKEKTIGKKILMPLAAIALILSAYIWHSVLLPQRELIGQLKNKYEVERRYIYEVSSFAKEYPDHENYLKKLDKKLGVLENIMPAQPDLSEFLNETERTSKAAGITVVGIRPLPEIKKDGYGEFPVEITIRGNFEGILEFYKKLENSRRFIFITSSVTSVSAAGQAKRAAPELESRIELLLYSYNNKL